MRNQNRSHRGGRGDERHNVAGVGELRAVAERLLEMGQQYLEQGREWLHEATRKEQGAHAGHEPGHHADHEPGAYRAGTQGSEPGSGGWTSSRGPGGYGAYAPDESNFSETGGNPGWGASAGYDYDDHRTREFDDRAEELARNRGRGGRRHHHHGRHDRPGAGAFEDPFLPGSYGFGGEGRRQGGSEQGGARWEQAYRAQGQGSYRGRGPRGYARSDARMLEDVNERLCDDPIVDATEIEVRCEQACIVLEGRVPTRWMKHRAEDIADAVAGVKDVDNRIRVAAEEPASMGDFDTRREGGSGTAGSQGAGPTAGGNGGSAGQGTAGSSGASGGSTGTSSSGGSGSAAFQTGSSQSSASQAQASGTSGGQERSQPSSTPGASHSTTGGSSTSSSGSQGGQTGASSSSPSHGGQAGDPSKTPQQPH